MTRRLLAALVTVLLLAGCSTGTGAPGSSGSPSGATPQRGGTITYGRAAAVTSFDLNNEITANNAFAIDKVFEPLVSFDTTGKIIPWLAEKYTVSPDLLTYTFILRPELQFSDGSPVTAADAKFSLERHLKVQGPLPLEAPIASITAEDEHTLTIVLKSPYTPFLSELSGFSNGIFPADFGGRSEKDFFASPIGTGPWVVQSWDPSGDTTFTANTHYWQTGKPYAQNLVFKVVADDTQRIQQLQAGQLSAIEDVAPATISQLQASQNVTVSELGSWAVEQVFFNTQNPYFADRHVRRAVAYALDREGITQATTFGAAETVHTLIPPTIQYSADVQALDNDQAAARTELAASAYPDGFSATLLIASGDSARTQEAQIIQAALKPLNIDVKIEAIELNAFRERFKAFNYDFMINSGQSDAPDPNGLITFQADPDGFSHSFWTHYTNPKVTRLMREGRVTADGADREKIYAEIQQILADDVPYIPLYNPKNVVASLASVHDLTPRINGSVLFQDVWLQQ
ncbi:MAG: ABC transporter substrate-binding protein [Propionicimonas sp.]|uniref:ABC transporter substrate-binding protein n=1 Tax=Propionicimonas sp. TaxID=1955623 RepID=UPI003D0D4B74